MTSMMLEKPKEVDIRKYNFIIRFWHWSMNKERESHQKLVKYRVAVITTSIGAAVGGVYIMLFGEFVILDTLWCDAIEVLVCCTGAMSAIHDFRKAGDNSKQPSNMDFLMDKIFKAIIHSTCVTSSIEILGGTISDHVPLFSGLIMIHLLLTGYQVLTKNWVGILVA